LLPVVVAEIFDENYSKQIIIRAMPSPKVVIMVVWHTINTVVVIDWSITKLITVVDTNVEN